MEEFYICKSVNNTKVYFDELKILRKIKYPGYYCFEFGKDKYTLKKRFYINEEDFKKDYEYLKSKKGSGNDGIQRK